MAKTHKFHCNLTSKSFPFSAEELSSTVFINQGKEQNRQLLQGFDGRDVVDSFGICQAWYMSNVLPITRGFSSVYYKRALDSIDGIEGMDEGQVPDNAILLKSNYDTMAILVPCHGGCAIYDPQVGGWVSHKIAGYFEGQVTHTFLKGVTYVCFAEVGIYVYNFETQELEPAVFTGITPSAMRGVTSCLNYLLLWDSEYIYWSSYLTATDFVPSLITGASSSKLLAQRGAITCILPIADGFVVYTTTQAIAAVYSNNAVDPWVFKEIPNSAGVAKAEHVALGLASDAHIAWTSSGMQSVTQREAQQIWPELSDSIAREIYTGFSVDRTYNKQGWPIHTNEGIGYSDLDQLSEEQVHAVYGSQYPFHQVVGEESATTPYTHIDWHAYLLAQPELTKASVPARIDWQGPFRIKLRTIGARYVVVSVGTEKDNRVELNDAGMTYGEGWEDSVFDRVDPEDPFSQQVDPTPAEFSIVDTDVDDADGLNRKKYYDFAYVYDIALNRWGRLDCEHADVFEYSSPSFEAKLTYQQCLDREAAEEAPWSYQQFLTENSVYNLVVEGEIRNVGEGDDLVAAQGYAETDITYNAVGVGRDLDTIKFGTGFGILSKSGGIFTCHLFDGKYFQQVHAAEGYDAALTLMRQEDESELGVNVLPHIAHGRYKINRETGVLINTVSMSKVVADSLVSVWAIPHAEDGECLQPEALTPIKMYQQDYATQQLNSGAHLGVGDNGEQQVAFRRKMQWAIAEHGKFAGRVAGDSVSILIAGHFTLSDLVVDLQAHGSRNFASAAADPDGEAHWWYFREVLGMEVPESYPPDAPDPN